MKKLSVNLLVGVILLALISCAGMTLNSTESMEQDQSDSSMEQAHEPKMVWKVEWETIMSPDGTVDKQIEYKYDEQGNLLKIIERDSRDELLYQRTYLYENSRLVSRQMSDSNGIVSLTLYENDSEGMIVQETKQDSHGDNLSIVNFDYQDGLVYRSVAADGNGVPRLLAEYSYIGEVVVEVKYLLPDGSEEAKFLRSLQSGKPTEEKMVLPDGTVETSTEFEYNSGILATQIHYAAGKLTKAVGFDYDSEGNIIREIWTNRNGRSYEIVERRWVLVEEME